MKAVSLWQPWASLIAVGVKRFETRSWPTSYRGQIAIHAAKNTSAVNELRTYGAPRALHDLCCRAFVPGWQRSLPYGALVCTADLVGCFQVRPRRFGVEQPTVELADRTYAPSADEQLAGDWSDGRWVWQLDNVVRLALPIETRGFQGLWDIDMANLTPRANEDTQGALFQ